MSQISALKASLNTDYKSVSHNTIFNSILDSKLPPLEKSVARLSQDAEIVVSAGTLTTSWTLEVITYWLIQQPSTLQKLKTELKIALPDPHAIVPLPVLEQLPYLNGVIKEGLRLTYGVASRHARISPDKPIIFLDGEKEWVIPPGTPVGMTSVQIHHDENIFPDSKKFLPERWLDGKSKDLDRYMVAFGGGSRKCLGLNLAYAELYLCLSAIWRSWGSNKYREEGDEGIFELFETGLRDVEIESDRFVPGQQPGSQGVRARLFK